MRRSGGLSFAFPLTELQRGLPGRRSAAAVPLGLEKPPPFNGALLVTGARLQPLSHVGGPRRELCPGRCQVRREGLKGAPARRPLRHWWGGGVGGLRAGRGRLGTRVWLGPGYKPGAGRARPAALRAANLAGSRAPPEAAGITNGLQSTRAWLGFKGRIPPPTLTKMPEQCTLACRHGGMSKGWGCVAKPGGSQRGCWREQKNTSSPVSTSAAVLPRTGLALQLLHRGSWFPSDAVSFRDS